MQRFTYGHLKIGTIEVSLPGPPPLVLAAMKRQAYVGTELPALGWGAPLLQEEDSGEITRGSVGLPSALRIAGRDAVAARLFFDAEDRSLKRRYRDRFEGLDAETRYQLFGVDSLMVHTGSTSDGMHTFSVVVASHDRTFINKTIEGLRRVHRDMDPDGETATQIVSPDPTQVLAEDFFFWLVERWTKNAGALGSGLSLVQFEDLKMVSPLGGKIRSWGGGGVSTTKGELLVAITEDHVFGPATLAVHDQNVGFVAELQLFNNGTFDVHRQGTVYDAGPLGRADLGLRSVMDVSFTTLPSLRQLFEADVQFKDRKAAFIEECRTQLNGTEAQ